MQKRNSNIILYSGYIGEIRGAVMLSAQEEASLVEQWIKQNDQDSAHKLVVSHLKLVYKICTNYIGYGIPVNELLSEGSLGLMHAVKKFDPSKGARLATYATLWIKAVIQEYILRSWSLVKIGNSAIQRKLFFNLRRLKNELGVPYNSYLSTKQADIISERLGVNSKDVLGMEKRLILSDQSLDVPLSPDSDNTRISLVSNNISLEDSLLDEDELNYRKKIILEIINNLDSRGREIFIARKMSDPVVTLHDLAKRYNISRERVRQIEIQVFNKICHKIKELYSNDNCLMLE